MHGVGEKGVQAHSGSLREGCVGQQGRQQTADGRADAGGQQDAVVVHAGGREHAGVDEDNVGHGEERGQAAYDLGADTAAALGDLKKFVHFSPPLLFAPAERYAGLRPPQGDCFILHDKHKKEKRKISIFR